MTHSCTFFCCSCHRIKVTTDDNLLLSKVQFLTIFLLNVWGQYFLGGLLLFFDLCIGLFHYTNKLSWNICNILKLNRVVLNLSIQKVVLKFKYFVAINTQPISVLVDVKVWAWIMVQQCPPVGNGSDCTFPITCTGNLIKGDLSNVLPASHCVFSLCD